MGSKGSVILKKGEASAEIKTINLPASKSISNRLLIIKALSGGAVSIKNLSNAKDSESLAEILESKTTTMDVGPAGTAMRFLAAYAAVSPGQFVLSGSPRMNERPIKPLVDALRSVGASIKYLEKEGFAPLEITGNEFLEGGKVEVDGSESSQFISALLMIGPYIKNGLLLKLKGETTSAPYIHMTCEVMKACGAGVYFINDHFIEVQPKPYSTKTISVESDWTAASYFFSWLALNRNAELKLAGLNEKSWQGDKKLIETYNHFGVSCTFEEDHVLIRSESGFKLPKKLSFDLKDTPDLAQTIACTAAALQIPLHLTGLGTLVLKETDRIRALQAELTKFGVVCQAGETELKLVSFNPPAKTNVKIKTYEDHRMAMSFAPMIAVFPEMEIEDPDVVEKSFPDFWQELKKAGVLLEETE